MTYVPTRTPTPVADLAKALGHPARLRILQLLADGKSWNEVCRITKASRSTLSRLTKAAKTSSAQPPA